jgi:hypothetical protein
MVVKQILLNETNVCLFICIAAQLLTLSETHCVALDDTYTLALVTLTTLISIINLVTLIILINLIVKL